MTQFEESLQRQLRETRAALDAMTKERDKLLGYLTSALEPQDKLGAYVHGKLKGKYDIHSDYEAVDYLAEERDYLRDLLREALCWITDGSRRTPEQRGAQMETCIDVREAIQAALASEPEEPHDKA